jgi:hypothetical protein
MFLFISKKLCFYSYRKGIGRALKKGNHVNERQAHGWSHNCNVGKPHAIGMGLACALIMHLSVHSDYLAKKKDDCPNFSLEAILLKSCTSLYTIFV